MELRQKLVVAALAVVGLTDPRTIRGANLDRPAADPGWHKLPSAGSLQGRSSSSVVWTGNELIVFGGEGMEQSLGDGARYDAAENAWRSLPAEGAPASRTQHSAVWTGTEMIVWGGFGGTWGNDTNRDDGARFDPRSNSWRPVSTVGAPQARFQHTAVWTGREMLIWGGYTDSRALYHGAYNNAYLNSGGAYDPTTDTWRELARPGAPSPRFNHAALWTGDCMMIWGGNDATKALNDGGIYDPATDTWTPVNTVGAPSPRKQPLAVWTGTEMIVWGGDSRDDRIFFRDGGRYNPATRQWTPLSTNGAPVGRNFANAVWTGSKMVFWGGINDAIGHTGRLPSLRVNQLSTVDLSSQSRTGLVLRGGQEVILSSAADAPPSAGMGLPVELQQLDGSNASRYLNSGAAYDPATDSWAPMVSANCPSARWTTAVWTGRGMLIFGGFNGSHLNDAYAVSF